MVSMAGIRTILVHGYDRVDPLLITDILKSHLHDFETVFDRIKACGLP
jgi:uncharacterized protein YutE (UPF0331/DUF86 family)